MSDVLIVIPARGGSRGIPRKAVRLLNGKSPLQYTLATVTGLGDVVVVTDDEEIGQQAASAGVRMLPIVYAPAPPPQLQTWEPAVYRAVLAQEQLRDAPYSAVAVVQCTSPFLRRITIHRCLDALVAYPLALTVRDDRRARIGTLRQPREHMPPCWAVTGGCTAIRRDLLPDGAWPVEQGLPIVTEGAEAVDLDTPEDWAVAEMYAGATERELLLARVLVPDTPHPEGTAVVLSAWDEARTEQQDRFRHTIGHGHCLSLHGAHTRDEAERAVAMRSGDDLTIITSAYHQPRAFLTFLKVLHDAGLARMVRLWNVPVPSRMERLAEEWHKITDYQAKGHVASLEEGLAYLDWRDRQVTACVT